MLLRITTVQLGYKDKIMGQTTFSGPVKSDGGFIENSFSTAERDALTPVIGLLIYNTDTNIYEVYGNSGWQPAFGAAEVTYTAGVDYSNLGPDFGLIINSGFGTISLAVQSAQWTNPLTPANALFGQPIGTVYTVVVDGAPLVLTTVADWHPGAPGFYIVNLSGSGAGFHNGTPVSSITAPV
jgi:hypothetical protein